MEKPGAVRPGFVGRLVRIARSRRLVPILFLIEVLETTILPLPYEALFVALCLSARDRIWLFVLVTVAGSAVAGAIMYGLGATYIDAIAERFGVAEAVAAYTAEVAERGATLIFLGGTTAAPSQLINMAAGAGGYPFGAFVAVFTGSRFLRFLVLGLALYWFGDDIARGWAKLPRWLKAGLTVLILAAVGWWFVSGVSD